MKPYNNNNKKKDVQWVVDNIPFPIKYQLQLQHNNFSFQNCDQF
jgi:hypothetical protein